MTGPVGPKRITAWLGRNFGVACVAVVLLYCLVRAFDPPRLNWGDSMSDYNVMTSGRNFAKYGFVQLRFTPFLMDPQYMHPGDQVFIYTHYPPLPDWMNGVERDVLGFDRLFQFRLVALFFSFAAFFFVYRLVAAYWSRLAAQIAIGLWATNFLWIQHADYLHNGPYGAFFGFGSVYFLSRHLREERRGFLYTSGAFLAMAMLGSYDYWFFAPILLVCVAIKHVGSPLDRRVLKPILTVGAIGALALVLKLATNAWVLGGIGGLVHDLRYQFTERATDSMTRTNYAAGAWPTYRGRIDRFFTPLFYVAIGFWIVWPFVKKRMARVAPDFVVNGPNPWWLFAAALPFLYLFTELLVGQYYPGLLILPFYAVAFAALIAPMIEMGMPLRLAGVGLIAGLVITSAVETISFPTAYFRTETIDRLRAQLDSVAAPGQGVITNTTFDGFYRQYFSRNAESPILMLPDQMEAALLSLSDPRRHPRTGSVNGAIFVEHKRVLSELYDKGLYYLLSRTGHWRAWGNPAGHRAEIDSVVAFRNFVLMKNVENLGTKLYDTPDYSIWRIKPHP